MLVLFTIVCLAPSTMSTTQKQQTLLVNFFKKSFVILFIQKIVVKCLCRLKVMLQGKKAMYDDSEYSVYSLIHSNVLNVNL